MDAFQKSPRKEVHVVVDRLVGPGGHPQTAGRFPRTVRTGIRRADRTRSSHRRPSRSTYGSARRRRHPEIRWVEHPAGTLVKFSEKFECQLCGVAYEEPEPRLFSFNNPFGACPECQGFGNTDNRGPGPRRSPTRQILAEGAVDPWTKAALPRFSGQAAAVCTDGRHPRRRSVERSGREQPDVRSCTANADSRGSSGFFDYLERKKYKMHVRIFISRYRGYSTLPSLQRRAAAPGGARRASSAANGSPEVSRLIDPGSGRPFSPASS